jgi:hypothetical protein
MKEHEDSKMAVKEVSQASGISNPTEPAMTSEVFHYSPLRFLQTMLAIAWSAFAHPFSTTVIDLATGEVRHEADHGA